MIDDYSKMELLNIDILKVIILNKYKVCVYAISKNEEKFVDRWVNSMSEADDIYVLDTGSTDSTVQLLKKRNVHVKSEKISPWRFDVARNKSLELVPNDADICVCTDLDEVFVSGWREKLEKAWNDKVTRARYNYNWSLDKNNNPIVNFYIEKTHSRKNYVWTHPVHEVLSYVGENLENIITIDGITVNHYPDSNKSRGNYLTLLELSVKEDPEDDRNMHYLGREYMYYGRWNEAIDTLITHLSLKRAVWKDERCASMRFIARSYMNLKRYDEAKMWLDKAMCEAPYLRDAYVERALLDYSQENYKDVIKYCEMALKITDRTKSYINEIFSWNHTIYDLLSIAYYHEKDYEKSLMNINKAIDICTSECDVLRLKSNKETIEEKLTNFNDG